MLISRDALVSTRTRRCRPFRRGSPPLHLPERFDAPPERVWEQLTSDASIAAWGPATKEVTWTSPRPFGVGTTREVTGPGGARLRERFFRWDEGSHHSFACYESTLPLFKRFAEDYIVEGDGTVSGTSPRRLDPPVASRDT